ncbi:nucleotide sugar dehydrogenase [Coralliovum pocilloporae]|uniref:nucleotide sugar dehydrogenase n=1 Tax=Coralliovum pocilloporae TaxID=3066369 RepID=UPI0033070841
MNIVSNSSACESHLEKLTSADTADTTISIIGLGYVGTVSAACMANLGYSVIGVDLDATLCVRLAAGISPVSEPGVGELLRQAVTDARLSATASLGEAIAKSNVTFVSVNTPTADDGSCNTDAIRAVAKDIGRALSEKDTYHLLVLRCSVPPGTTEGIFQAIVERWSGKTAGQDFGVCFNPEFLRESTAVEDFNSPPKTIIGASDDRAGRMLATLLAPIDQHPIHATPKEAEMVKYADNVWHAAKVCFGNEIGRLCHVLDIDGHRVMDQFCQDQVLNISPQYLKPGFAYGGSCLPKEVRAMAHLGRAYGVGLPLVDSLPGSNETQICQALDLIVKTQRKRIGICGLTFKPDTDDLRESPSTALAKQLLDAGYEAYVADPLYTKLEALHQQAVLMKPHYPEDAATLYRLTQFLCSSTDELLRNCDVIVTVHKSDYWADQLRGRTDNHHIVDVSRLFHREPDCVTYQGIGW